MKITYLGTAAAEGFPALFCNCKYCNEARKAGGKNIRTRSQALINDNLLIDFPADTYSHFLQNDIRGDKIEYLLISHAHPDHFYLADLFMRNFPYSHNMSAPTLKLFCPKTVYEAFDNIPKNIEATILQPYQTVDLGQYKITALPAKHMLDSQAFIYIIQGEKTLLYAHDTGYFYDEVINFIQKNKFVFDMVSLDCTNVDIPISDAGTHMGFINIERLLNRLFAIGAITDSTLKYVNHFSHNGNPLHHILEDRAKQYDCLVSYDGCKVLL
ncbi:MAG: MBL fold metallo-hydrolase [Clostridia bacterium]|nr:MBL fold metallo-hydrolase [Clostridia bacterium]